MTKERYKNYIRQRMNTLLEGEGPQDYLPQMRQQTNPTGSSSITQAALNLDRITPHGLHPDTVAILAAGRSTDMTAGATRFPLADAETARSRLLPHEDPGVALAALAHPSAEAFDTHIAARHEDPSVVLAALAHPEADAMVTQIAARHIDSSVALAALAHPKANADTTHMAARHIDLRVVLAGIAHPSADWATTHIALRHNDPRIVRAVRERF